MYGLVAFRIATIAVENVLGAFEKKAVTWTIRWQRQAWSAGGDDGWSSARKRDVKERAFPA